MKRKPTDFTRLFTQIAPGEIADDVFTLVGQVFPVITAGTQDHFNSMTASGGGMGMLMKKPTTWCILGASRYTLKLMQQRQAYTLSYFPDTYKEQLLFLGSKSGRESDKMKEVALTPMKLPSQEMSFQEARLIIECKLTQIATAHPEDFYSKEARDYLREAYKDASDYRKYVFGEITGVWVKKTEEILA